MLFHLPDPSSAHMHTFRHTQLAALLFLADLVVLPLKYSSPFLPSRTTHPVIKEWPTVTERVCLSVEVKKQLHIPTKSQLKKKRGKQVP